MFGKVELITTFSLEVYARAIDLLESERIKYFIKTTYTGSRGRGAGVLASYSERPELDTQYQIFVKKTGLRKGRSRCKKVKAALSCGDTA